MTFHYQKFRTRVLWGVPLVFVCMRLHAALAGNIASTIPYVLLGVAILVPAISIYFRLSENWPLFIEESAFETTADNMLLVRTGSRIRVFNEISEVLGWNAALYGSLMCVVRIRYGGGKIVKYYSLPRKRSDTLKDTELYPLFQAAVSVGTDMRQQADITGKQNPYHFKQTKE